MIAQLKRLLYFPIASYFRFFAAIRLRRWKPRILIVTGSTGKTTLFHLLEAQFGKKARYAHHANSSFGVPFHILGLERKTLLKSEWVTLFLLAPFRVFAPLPKESLYIVECDCDRPGEGKFLAELLRPEVVLWISTSRTHSVNFDHLVLGRGLLRNDVNEFATVEEAIAYEYGYYLAYCSQLVVVDGDSQLEMAQTKRTKAKVVTIKKSDGFGEYSVGKEGTTFQIVNEKYTFSALLPEDVFYGIVMCQEAVAYFGLTLDEKFSRFVMPPGRGSIFAGMKQTTLIDSSYNATPASIRAILGMYNKMAVDKKWAVISDMIELGLSEQEEHEKLADLLARCHFDRIILMGPRVKKYTYPKVLSLRGVTVVCFETPKEVIDYLLANIRGGEIILFKGARFLEGVIEHLLLNKDDVKKLARREKIWEIRRKQWGL